MKPPPNGPDRANGLTAKALHAMPWHDADKAMLTKVIKALEWKKVYTNKNKASTLRKFSSSI
jgi:hypothetical protein